MRLTLHLGGNLQVPVHSTCVSHYTWAVRPRLVCRDPAFELVGHGVPLDLGGQRESEEPEREAELWGGPVGGASIPLPQDI